MLVANSVRNALVAPYMTVMGHGMKPAGEDVKKMAPRVGEAAISLRMRAAKWWVMRTGDIALHS